MNADSTKHITLGAALTAMLLATSALQAAGAPPSSPDQRVQVSWGDPAQLSEVKENATRRPDNSVAWLKDLQKYLVRRADVRLPEGDRLDVRFNDVKLAGSFEPWRGTAMDNVRIVKDIYPPRIDLSFTLTDANGRVIDSGDRKLRDIAFLTRGIVNDTDPLRYEKRMLDDWLSREFGEKKTPIADAR